MKATIAILCAALVALGSAVIHLWRQLDASRHHVAGLQAQVDTTAAFAPQAASAATAATSSSLPSAVPSVTTTAVTADSFRSAGETLAIAMIRARSPEGLADAKVVYRGQVATEYPDVGKALGLSPDEVGRLYDLLTEHAVRQLSLDRKGHDSLERAAQLARSELASLLGSKYEKWLQYKAELPTRLQVRDLAARLSSAGMPLSEAQRDSLIPAVVAVEKSNSQERAARFGQGSKAFVLSRFSPEANQRILDAAAAHLTPQQLESYRQLLERGSGMQDTLRNMILGPQG